MVQPGITDGSGQAVSDPSEYTGSDDGESGGDSEQDRPTGGGPTGGGLDPGGAGGTGDDTGGSGDTDPEEDDFDTTDEATGGGGDESAGGGGATGGGLDPGGGGTGDDTGGSGDIDPEEDDFDTTDEATRDGRDSPTSPLQEGGGAPQTDPIGERVDTGSTGQTLEEQAAGAVETTLEEGVEGQSGQSVEVDGEMINVQAEARAYEQQVIESEPWADDPSDVAIRVEDGQLVAQQSRSAAVEDVESRIRLYRDAPIMLGGRVETTEAESRPAQTRPGVGLDPGGGGLGTSGDDTGGTRSDEEGIFSQVESTLDRAQQEGFESVERGGAFSDAARDITATGLGVLFQDPEEIGSQVGISEQRIQQQDTTISGPGVTGINPVSDEQLVELDYGERGELNERVVSDLTRGQGFLSDDERGDVQEDIQQRQQTFGLGDEAASAAGLITDDERATGFARGVGRLTGDLTSATAGITLAADTAAETVPNIPGAVSEYGAGEVGYTVLESGGRATEGLARGIEARPYEFAGSLGGALVGGALAGRAAGGAARYGRDRVRTAGADVYDAEGGAIVNPGTGRYYSDPDADVDGGSRFPGAEDPDLYESQPAVAVRTQAEDYTPEGVEQRYQQQGVDDGTTLKKAIEVEPEGPGRGRRGFETQEGSYESPGGFAGPELSPNFLGLGRRGSRFSLRPGLPDLGDQATGVLVRTDVGESRARNLDEFNEELLDRTGETTARTKPASEVSSSEIEAVIPPEAEFADIGGGAGRNLMRRVGVGSDFAVRFGGRRIPFTDRRVGGRRVPLRPVADPDLVETQGGRSFGDFLRSERGQLGADTGSTQRTRRLSEIQRPVETPTDRPIPVPPSAPSADRPPADSAPTSESAVERPARDGIETESATSTVLGQDRSSESPDSELSSSSFAESGTSTAGSVASGGGAGSPTPSTPSSPGGQSPPGSPSGPPSSSGLPPAVSDSPGAPSSPSPGSPRPPTTPSNPIVQRPDGDRDSDDDEFVAPLSGSRDPVFTDFLDPLTGETLVTSDDRPL